jgi:hypothetical protein
MRIHQSTVKLGILTLVMPALLLIGGGCRSKYWRTDEQGKLISPIHDSCSFRNTEFERSLCEADGSPYALEKVSMIVRISLISDLALRHGPASEPALVLKQLDSCDVTRDSVRVQQLLERGMLELDYGWAGDSTTSMDEDILERAASIIRLACYNPNSPGHLDELGKLIALHGPAKLESWTETTLTVSFRDGTTHYLEEDYFNDRRIRASARSYEHLSAELSKTGEPDDVDWAAASMDMQQAVHKTVADQRRVIDIPVDFIPLEFAGVYLHVLPTDSLGRPLNGQPAAPTGMPWEFRCAYLDCFLNLDEFRNRNGTTPDSLLLDLVYTIERSSDGNGPLVSETLPFHMKWPPAGNEGLSFRICTRPIRCPIEEEPVDFELSLRADYQGRTIIRKFPFSVEPASHELLVARNSGSKDAAMPLCQRTSSARIGSEIDLLVPLVNVPPSSGNRDFRCQLDLYLVPEREPNAGNVTVGPAYPLKDSTDTPPGFAVSYDSLTISPYLICSREIRLAHPNAYSGQTVRIPRKYSDGAKIKRGNYLLAGDISVDGRYHSRVWMTRLTLE